MIVADVSVPVKSGAVDWVDQFFKPRREWSPLMAPTPTLLFLLAFTCAASQVMPEPSNGQGDVVLGLRCLRPRKQVGDGCRVPLASSGRTDAPGI
jgi:hypothetical protein